MKKVLAIICATVMLTVGLTACGKKNPDETGSNATSKVKSSQTSGTTSTVETVESIGAPSVKKPANVKVGGARVISIKLESESILVQKNHKGKINATVLPKQAADPSIYWSSDDETVVKVDKDGYVLGIKPGAATITAETNDNGFKKTCMVYVYENAGDIKMSQQATDLLNQARKDAKKKEFKTDNVALQASANQRAYEGGNIGNFKTNNRPDGRDQSTIFTDYKIWARYSATPSRIWGDFDATQIVKTILRSDDTKASIMDDNYTDIAVGYYSKDGVKYWVVLLMGEL